MPKTKRTAPRWPQRLASIPSQVKAIHLPKTGDDVSQDAEWCEVEIGAQRRRIRFHDYDEIYRIPGLYEKLFYETLKCCSPNRTVRLLEDVLGDYGQDIAQLRVLDLGAGNGMVGDELNARDAEHLIGIDVIEDARKAALRDRPGLYDNYFVQDMTDLPEPIEKQLREAGLNCLTTVAALGFGDIPPQAFIKALDLIETHGWLAFTIKEDFLRKDDETSFSTLINMLACEEIIQVETYRRFRHRVNISGDPLYYVAMIARKLEELPDTLFPEFAQ